MDRFGLRHLVNRRILFYQRGADLQSACWYVSHLFGPGDVVKAEALRLSTRL